MCIFRGLGFKRFVHKYTLQVHTIMFKDIKVIQYNIILYWSKVIKNSFGILTQSSHSSWCYLSNKEDIPFKKNYIILVFYNSSYYIC